MSVISIGLTWGRGRPGLGSVDLARRSEGTSATAADPAETLLERYLVNRRYTFDYELDLGTGKRPDYLIHANGSNVVCEVESFTRMGIFASASRNKVGTRSQAEALAPVHDRIKKAAAQLKGISDRPLLIVMANPLGRTVPSNQRL